MTMYGYQLYTMGYWAVSAVNTEEVTTGMEAMWDGGDQQTSDTSEGCRGVSGDLMMWCDVTKFCWLPLLLSSGVKSA